MPFASSRRIFPSRGSLRSITNKAATTYVQLNISSAARDSAGVADSAVTICSRYEKCGINRTYSTHKHNRRIHAEKPENRILCGWSAQGSRPTFELVTGVSTGALTAPFAYLGSSYDPQLRAVYTQLSPDDVLTKRVITAALFDDAMTDNSPLFRTISRYLNEEMLAAIAKGYDEGRLLLIASTDLDAQQPVIWNIGAIAKSGHPRALDTIRRVLLASAAVPGAFPPMMFDVTLDGKPHQEMHVDGGAFAQAFLYPVAITRQRRERLSQGKQVVPAVSYIIRNGRLDPEWSAVERRTLGIAGRAISTMIAASGYNDVIRMYNNTQRDGIGFNLAYIGSDFTKELPAPFDQGFMRALFDYGYQRAVRGYEWAHKPPLA
jgi:predicted acylesterase/phospholipase RssA